MPLLRRLAVDIQKSSKDEATKILQQILAVAESHLGEMHCNNAYLLDQLARFFENRGVNELALSCLSNCSKVLEATVGRDHLVRVNILKRMARIYTTYKDSLTLAKESLVEVIVPYQG